MRHAYKLLVATATFFLISAATAADEPSSMNQRIADVGGIEFIRNGIGLSGTGRVRSVTSMAFIVDDENGAQVSMALCNESKLFLPDASAGHKDFKPGDEVSFFAMRNIHGAWELESATNISIRRFALRGFVQTVSAGVATLESRSGKIYQLHFSEDTHIFFKNRQSAGAADLIAGKNIFVVGVLDTTQNIFREIKLIRMLD